MSGDQQENPSIQKKRNDQSISYHRLGPTEVAAEAVAGDGQRLAVPGAGRWAAAGWVVDGVVHRRRRRIDAFCDKYIFFT